MSAERTTTTEFADLARALGAADGENDRLMLAVEAAVELIPNCLHAGVTINRGGHCHTLASSGELLRVINELQNELDEGPCHTPDRTEEVVVVDDLATDDRFATWGARVHAEHQLATVASILVFTARGYYGTMSIYGTGPHAFDEDDLATAQALAGHLAVAIAAGREIDGMGVALQSRTVIGQAEGILMERLGVDVDQALAYLKRVSSQTNTKLVQVASEIVRTRQLPGA
ncbi:GAF and ANTAR domain-containing protein [Nocardioides KLBMP 9356]|uniref:GAF and ANTAR domain-containing protein n=1 Tax=Nocardioides potassii TaxID=2911371 RepID=A0ABS9HC23_9ACTN|nr:GAF and ANTAR domain-containing protein [Nocardioides potassii]MCF6377893.1 GAF and ANTAR domain-containing protein [Nocardioides potassii]